MKSRTDWLRFDVIAGLTAAAVVVPKAMAYATIAGLPLEVGLYTAMIPMVVYAMLGSSRVLSVSSTATLSILVGAELGRVCPGGGTAELIAASATLSVLVGAMLALAGLLRLGFVANFISESVLVGFKSAIGLVIVFDQLPKLLGVHFDKHGFLRDLAGLATHLPQTSLVTLAVGAGVILVLVALPRVLPRAPAPLVALGLAIAASMALGLQASGLAVVGSVPRSLPSFVLPQLGLLAELWPAALGIALMSFTESIAAARAFAGGGERRPVPNRELLALGAANAAGGLFGAMVAGGGTSQTAVLRKAGARTRMAGAMTAVGALATLLFLSPLLACLPQAALAAVVIVYSAELIAPAEFRAIRAVRRNEFRWALIAFAGVVLLGTLQGILVAVIVSLLSLAQQEMRPPVYALGRKRSTNVFRPPSAEHPDDETWPGLLLVRAEGRLFFANAEGVMDALRPMVEAASPKVVVLDGSGLIDIEYSALKMLTEAEKKLDERGISLWLAALNPAVFEIISNSEVGRRLGRERLFFNLEQAVEAYQARSAPVSPSR
jgi:high affinity sulfate transporter 1